MSDVSMAPDLPGTPEVWKVGDRWYIVYWVYGGAPLVWEGTEEEIRERMDDVGEGVGTVTPTKTMSQEEFEGLSPWMAGRVAEIRATGEDPWTQFYSDFNEDANLRPWLRDPEILAVYATAHLEGRAPTIDEFAQTAWWNENTAAEREFLESSVTSGDAEMERVKKEKVREITDVMLGLGLKDVPWQVIDFIAHKSVTGEWAPGYVEQQIRKLADPYAVGQLNPWVAQLVENEGANMRTTRVEEDTVRETALRWLGPTMGNMSQAEIERWAGRLRNNPDAMVEFEEHLRQQRMALFPNYTNENLTYEDIVSPFRRLAENTWGRAITDEAMLVDLANTGDYMEAQKRLRKAGLDQGIQKVVRDAVDSLGSTAMGERVVRSAI